MNWYKTATGNISISIDQWLRSIKDAVYDLISDHFSKEEADADIQRMTGPTNQNMQQIAQHVQQAINNIPDWHNSPIKIEAYTYDRQNEFGPEDSATVGVGGQASWGGSASFTYFNFDGQVDIEDVLEAGDTDFFSESDTQSDYFNLVQELRSSGSSQEGEILTLYTARPSSDREVYMNASQIPSNIFFTTDYNRARGIGSDLGGKEGRDIWQVQINSKYLINTLDAPGIKDYQAVGQGMVPVESIMKI
jgi:hypothetical protein